MAAPQINSAEKIQMDYMRLLTVQLQNQNPLEPMDNHDMAMQLAQFSQLEQLESMSRTFQKVLQATDRSQASTLIGKHVTFLTPGSFQESSGRVNGVEIVNDEARLRVGSILHYTANDMTADGDTRVDELDQTQYLEYDDSIVVMGIRPDGTTLGDGQGATIALGERIALDKDGVPYTECITMDKLLATITDAFRSNGQKTYTAELKDGEICLRDEDMKPVYGVMNLYYQTEGKNGKFELPQQITHLPSMGELTSITN